MSFSITLIGTPEAVKRGLEAHGAILTGQSQAEFKAALPALETLLDQNVNIGVVRLDANGHASFGAQTPDGPPPAKLYGQCAVSLTVLGKLAE